MNYFLVAGGFAYALKTYVFNDEKFRENDKIIDMGAAVNELTLLTIVLTNMSVKNVTSFKHH